MEQEFEFAPRYRIGNEAIAYQLGSNLHNNLQGVIEEMCAVGTFITDTTNRAKMAKVIFDATGINVIINVVQTPIINACVYIPDLDKNHPIINNYARGYRSNTDLHRVLNFNSGKFVGVIDRKNGKFLGDFSKMIIPIHVTTGLLTEERLTIGERAAGIMHELGHIATYFERILDFTSLNYAAAYTAERVLKLGTDKERVELLSEFEKATSTELRDKETIVTSENGQVIFTHLVFEATRQRRNEEGDEIYSYRGFEFSSDQFVTRHGAGRDLSTLIAKLDSMNFGSSSMPWTLHVMIQLSQAMLAVVGTCGLMFAVGNMLATFVNIQNLGVALLSITWILSAITSNDTKIYDDPKERITRVRNEMVGALKVAVTPEQRTQIVNDIAVLDAATENVIDKPTWFDFVRTYMPTDYRKSKTSREFQQGLEKLMNNDAFVAAAQLKDLTV